LQALPINTHAQWVYRLLNGKKPLFTKVLGRQLAAPPSVPTTSIFSRSDGIVPWQDCVQQGRARHVENIEVKGSHCGLGWNREVFQIVADHLRQAPGQWQPMG
jgi:hypothetical protein